MKEKKLKLFEFRHCLWCGKKFKTRVLNGYQPLMTSCSQEHKRLAEEKRIKEIEDTRCEESEQRIG